MHDFIESLRQLHFITQDITLGAPELSFNRYSPVVFCSIRVYIRGSMKDAKFVREMFVHLLRKSVCEGIITDEYVGDLRSEPGIIYNQIESPYFDFSFGYYRKM